MRATCSTLIPKSSFTLAGSPRSAGAAAAQSCARDAPPWTWSAPGLSTACTRSCTCRNTLWSMARGPFWRPRLLALTLLWILSAARSRSTRWSRCTSDCRIGRSSLGPNYSKSARWILLILDATGATYIPVWIAFYFIKNPWKTSFFSGGPAQTFLNFFF